MAHDRLICPICDGTAFDELAPTSGYPAGRCRGCGLGIEERLSKDPARAYARAAYDPHRDANAGSDRWQRFHHDSAVAADRLAQLRAVLPRDPGGRRWVDVGCNNGAFLVAARRAGWSPVGVEADPEDAREVAALLGVPVLAYPVWAAAPSPNADAVSLFDVLEHVLDPVGTFVAAARSLRPGGVLVVECPDLGARTTVVDWKHRRITKEFTEHIWHFSERSLSVLAARYAPTLRLVHVARPVEDKIQVAWSVTAAEVAR